MYRVVKFVVSLALLALLIYTLDWRVAFESLGGAESRWLLAALAISVMGVILSAEKWRGLLNDSLIPVGLGLAARLYWIGMFFSNFLPTSVGGDAVRLMLTPAPGRLQYVAGTILIERLTGFVVLLALSGVGLALAPALFSMPVLHQALVLLVVGLSIATTLLIAIPAPLGRVLAWATGFLPAVLQRPVVAARRLTTTVARQARRRSSVVRALVLSLPFYATVLLAQYFCLRAVGAEVPPSHVLVLGATVQLTAALPISINGLGIAEGTFVGLYTAMGAVPEVALAAALARRLVDLVNSAAGSLFWFTYSKEDAAAERERACSHARMAAAAHR